jgi:hypothetical protein
MPSVTATEAPLRDSTENSVSAAIVTIRLATSSRKAAVRRPGEVASLAARASRRTSPTG